MKLPERLHTGKQLSRWKPSGKMHHVDLFKYISEVCTVSIIRVMMEEVCTSEMLVYFNKTTWHYIPEGSLPP
jgi:hypothetical protein